MRLRAGSTAKNPTLRSGRQCAAALTAPAGHDGTPRTGPHPQAETMHAGSAPVVRLEGPLALGHGVLLVVSRIAIRPLTSLNGVGSWVGRRCLAAGRRGPQAYQPRSQPYRRLSGDCLRVLTRLGWVKLGLAQRSSSNTGENIRSHAVGDTAPGTITATNRSTPQRTLKNPIGMQRNGWQPHGKLLASGNAVSDWSGARQRSEDGGSTSCLGDLHGLSPARRSRAVAERLRSVYDHPLHTCV
jgi:hypothetical protein